MRRLNERSIAGAPARPLVGYPRPSAALAGALAARGRRVDDAGGTGTALEGDPRRELALMTRRRLIERAARLRRSGAGLEE